MKPTTKLYNLIKQHPEMLIMFAENNIAFDVLKLKKIVEQTDD